MKTGLITIDKLYQNMKNIYEHNKPLMFEEN